MDDLVTMATPPPQTDSDRETTSIECFSPLQIVDFNPLMLLPLDRICSCCCVALGHVDVETLTLTCTSARLLVQACSGKQLARGELPKPRRTVGHIIPKQ